MTIINNISPNDLMIILRSYDLSIIIRAYYLTIHIILDLRSCDLTIFKYLMIIFRPMVIIV
jgi:hypothetical protein